MCIRPVVLALAAALGWAQDVPPPGAVEFYDSGSTVHGEWEAQGWVAPAEWRPETTVVLGVRLTVSPNHLAGLLDRGIRADGLCLLVTAERTFDADGWLRLPNDERMSTLLTPTGLPIEGGMQGALSKRIGSPFRTPVDEFQVRRMTVGSRDEDGIHVHFRIQTKLPSDLPPGIYRLLPGLRGFGRQAFLQPERRLIRLSGTVCYQSQSPGRIARLYAAVPGRRPARLGPRGGGQRHPAANAVGVMYSR